MTLSNAGAETQGPETAPATSAQPGQTACTACSSGRLASELVRTVFWSGERPVILEDVPALVCQHCGEQYFEDETAMMLDLMRGRGFPADEAVREMTVPVFTYRTPDTGAKRGTGDDIS